MNFGEKLNLLMNTFKVNNVKLSRGINVDPSLVSRWKKGERLPSDNSPYIPAIAKYFLSLSSYSYQIEYLMQTLNCGFQDFDRRLIFLSNWLASSGSEKKSNPVNNETVQKPANAGNFISTITTLINSTANIPRTIPSTPFISLNNMYFNGETRKYECFKGVEGKRQAVINFFSAVLASEKPLELLLTSQQGLDWVLGDKEFASICSRTLAEVIRKGHNVTWIHEVNRNPTELMNILEHWAPILTTGKLRSYIFIGMQAPFGYLFKPQSNDVFLQYAKYRI